MSKLLTRLSLKKQLYCIEIKDFCIICPNRVDLFQVSLSCQRGKSTKQIFSGENQIGNDKITFNEPLLHISQFYVSNKKGTVQKKMFNIVVKGFDSIGKSI